MAREAYKYRVVYCDGSRTNPISRKEVRELVDGAPRKSGKDTPRFVEIFKDNQWWFFEWG